MGYPILVQQRKSTSLQQGYDKEGGVPKFPNVPTFEDGTINYTQKTGGDEDMDEAYQPTQFYWVGDKINRMPIIRSTPTYGKSILMTEAHKGVRDHINFMIEAVNTDDPEETDAIVFRAYLEGLDDDYAAKWNEFRYNGRSEPFYTYGNFKRSMNFSFKVAASSRTELKPLYMKLNYLLTQTAGDYKKTRLRGNYCRLTIGDYLTRVPGVFPNIKLKWDKNYPWEIAYGQQSHNIKEGIAVDHDVYQLPHILDVSCQFLPIHDFIPRKHIFNSPFIGPSDNLSPGVTVNGLSGHSVGKWFGYGTSHRDEILRNDRDDKEELRQERELAEKQYEDDMAEMAAMDEAERKEREEEDRLRRIAEYEAEEEAERDANEKAGKGRLTNWEVQMEEEENQMYDELEEEDDEDDW